MVGFRGNVLQVLPLYPSPRLMKTDMLAAVLLLLFLLLLLLLLLPFLSVFLSLVFPQVLSLFKFFMCRDLERKMYMYNKRGLFNYYFLEMYKLLIQSEDTTYISQITILKAMFYLY